jgi:hypothetical protein
MIHQIDRKSSQPSQLASLFGFLLIALMVGIVIAPFTVDSMLPSVTTAGATTIFHTTRSMLALFAVMMLFFFFIAGYIFSLGIRQRNDEVKRNMFATRMFITTIMLILSVGTAAVVLYLSSKTFTVGDQGMQLTTLFSDQKLSWSQAQHVTFHFVGNSRIGPYPNYNHLEFIDHDGSTIILDLRFFDGYAIRSALEHRVTIDSI